MATLYRYEPFLVANHSDRLMCNSNTIKICVRMYLEEEGKDKELIQSSTTPDPGHHMRK